MNIFGLALIFILNGRSYCVSGEVMTYHLTDEELETFFRLKRALEPSYEPLFQSHHSGASYNTTSNEEAFEINPEKTTYWPGKWLSSGNTAEDCIAHSDVYARKRFQFKWLEAQCLLPNSSPEFLLNCSSIYRVIPSSVDWEGAPWIFHQVCPPPKVCIDLDLGAEVAGAFPGFTYKNIACVERDKLTIKQHAAVAMKGARSSAESEPDWCSLPEIVPGLGYPSIYHMTSFLLTEEVSWANGSYYQAPKLYIRDSPSHYKNGFDRAYKQNTNVVSTIINVGSARGRLQSRAVNFCMELIRGGHVWTVMVYTWFRYTPRRGIVPAELDYVPEVGKIDQDT